ncbi:MAG: hypothetical protein A2571_00460 [Candidatus Vogelbacteria bacterium RIFOXYD1_FULL_44_32]|uniref:Uncharacterized protein n=1 Tax=Candidatus Vogelbacteria bacterium RIFOXYD1_FULL_44_32 TaxID=1802438 RepID=A0A1G2QE58_9BACT|nr:MAG: hypothetical protein A2571_00460 [Candidatus Vogelbacteria bacterium RIFOXYD1_FULL_44_32]
MKIKYIFIVILFIVLTAPNVVFAAWWNPFSWFSFAWNKEKVTEYATSTDQNKDVKKTIADIKTETNIKSVNQQSEINGLKKEIGALKAITNEPKPTNPIVNYPAITDSASIIAPESVEPALSDDPEIKVDWVGSNVYSRDGGTYGSYSIDISITAGNKDVYVPQATSNSKNMTIGFFYTVDGKEFNGTQDSDVNCGLMRENFCRIKAGKTSKIGATIWLIPYSSGNYSVKFLKMMYRIDGESKMRTFELNENVGPLFIE